MADLPSKIGVLLFSLLVVAVAVTGFVGASSPPTPVCPTCGVQLEEASSGQGTPVSVTHSEVDIYVYENGSARWMTRNTLTPTSTRNLTRTEATELVETALADHRMVEPADPRVTLTENQLQITYDVSNLGTTRTAGVLLLDAFQRGNQAGWLVNADRFTIHAPPEHGLANDPGGTTNSTAVTFTGDSQDRWGGPSSLSGDTFIAFTRAGTSFADARADLAIAAYLLPAALGDLFRFGLIPTLVLGAAVLLYPRFGVMKAVHDVDSDRLAAITIGVAATLIGLPLALGTVWFGMNVTTSILAAGFGMLATALALRYPETTTLRNAIEGAIAGLLAFAASNIVVIALSSPQSIQRAVASTAFVIFLALPVVALLPLGYADATKSRYTRHLRVLIVATPAVLIATRVPIETGGLGSLFFLILPIVSSVLLAIFGLLPYWVGVRLAAAGPESG